MAGVYIKLEGDEKILAVFNQLIRQSSDLSPAFRDIGNYLIESTQQRFKTTQQAPDGTPWEALSALTLSRKKRDDKILTESGTLASTLLYQASDTEFEMGSNEEYAAMMHFGGTTSPKSMFPNKKIPARLFLGVSAEDEDEILALLQSHLVM